MDTYYNALSQVVVLDPSVEKDLFRKYQKSKCQNIRRQLIESCLKLVFSLARKYWMDQDPETLQALISAGNVGLLEAVEKFDPERGARFASYASFWILMHIRSELTILKDTVVPSAKERKLRMRSAASRRLLGLESRPSNRGAYSNVDDLSEYEVYKASKTNNYPLTEDSPETNLCPEDASKLFSRWFRFLTVREQFILRAYYGLLGDGDGLKLRQIADYLGLSSERVRQIKAAALEKLHRWLSYDGVTSPSDVI